MFWLALPRASVGQRIVAVCLIAILCSSMLSMWHDLNDQFPVSWILKRVCLVVFILQIPQLLLVLVLGRIPRSLRLIFDPKAYNRSFGESVEARRRELEDERKRSREM